MNTDSLPTFAGKSSTEHSGDDSQPATFLDDPEHLEHTTQVLEWIAWQIKDKDNVVGLEILNEPNPDDHSRIDAWCRLRNVIPIL